MTLIKSVFFPSGAGQCVELKLDTTKYDSALLTAVGGSLTQPASTNAYTYRSIKGAVKTGAVIRAKVTVKLGKKTRNIFVVADKDKVSTLKAALLTQKIKVGGTTKVDWDVTDVSIG